MDDTYSIVRRLAIGVHLPAQHAFNAKISHRGRYKSPSVPSVTGARRSTVAVAGNLAPSPYRRASTSQPAEPAAHFTPNMFGRPSTALTGQRLPPHAMARPRLPSNAAARQRATTVGQASKARKAYQVVRISPSGSRGTSQPTSQKTSQAASRDASRPPSREGAVGSHGQVLVPITLDQVRAQSLPTTSAP